MGDWVVKYLIIVIWYFLLQIFLQQTSCLDMEGHVYPMWSIQRLSHGIRFFLKIGSTSKSQFNPRIWILKESHNHRNRKQNIFIRFFNCYTPNIISEIIYLLVIILCVVLGRKHYLIILCLFIYPPPPLTHTHTHTRCPVIPDNICPTD